MNLSPTTPLTEPITPLAGPATSAPPGRRPIAMLGVVFDAVTTDEALARIQHLVTERRPSYVVTPNVDFLAQAHDDRVLRRILREARLVVCDGMPLVWASRWLGNPLPERVAGADLAPRLMALAAEKKWRVFLLGGSPEASALAAGRLRARHPDLALAGNYAPPNQPLAAMDHGEIVRRIRAAQPDLLFVSFGCPKQEKWIAMHYRTLGVPVCLGVGAVIDFLAGRLNRAPRWMRRTGLEWLYRLGQEPRRLCHRYLADARFFSRAVFAQLWQINARTGGPDGVLLRWIDRRGWQHAEVIGRLDRQLLSRQADGFNQIAHDERSCLFDLADVTRIDSTGLAWLARLHQQFVARGQHLWLRAPTAAVSRTLEIMQFEDFFEMARPDGNPAGSNGAV